MSNKKEKSAEILKLIESFNHEFGESYDLDKSISCIHGIDVGALTSNRKAINDTNVSGVKPNGDLTFAIIKPNSVENRDSANIIADIEEAGLSVYASNLKVFSKEEAEDFYDEHRGKFFCDELVEFMTSGPVITLVLERTSNSEENAIKTLRNLMGPVEAIEDKEKHSGTLRAKYAESMTKNSIHGSDSPEAFEREVKFF